MRLSSAEQNIRFSYSGKEVMSALPVTVTVKFVVLFFCKFSPPKKKFARKKGHSTKERNVFVNFFLLCYALESSRPRLDFPLEDHGAAIFSSISYALVSLQRLSILSFLSYLSDRFIKSSLIQLYSPQFRCMAALYNITWTNVKQMFVFLRKNFEIYLSYAQ